MKKREFIKYGGLIAGAMISGNLQAAVNNTMKKSYEAGRKGSSLKLKFRPYDLQLKHVFTIATNSRTTTPVVLTEIEYDGFKGYGEASMPPYLGESIETASAFLNKIDLSGFHNPFELEKILAYVVSTDHNNIAAKASVDIALHDLTGKLLDKPWYDLWGFDKEKTP